MLEKEGFRLPKNKYRSVQELRSSSKLFRYLILFEAIDFEFIVEQVLFGLI